MNCSQGTRNPVILALVEHIKAISTITNKDYAELVSTFITLTEPKYRCMDCKRKYSSDKVKMQKQFEFMACHYYDTKPRHNYVGAHCNKGNPTVLYNNCIGNHYNGYWASIINYYQEFEKGIMPFEGGYMEQPAKFVEVMDLVHNLIKENEEEKKRKNDLISRNKSGKRPSKR